MATITISDWKPRRSGALRGFVTVTLPSGMILHEICVLETSGKAWCAPPSKPMLGRDGAHMLDANGKKQYSQIIEFTTKEIRDRFSAAVIAALLTAHPEALADE